MLRHGQGPLSAASFRLAISFETSMSALGQKQTFALQKVMSALPPIGAILPEVPVPQVFPETGRAWGCNRGCISGSGRWCVGCGVV